MENEEIGDTSSKMDNSNANNKRKNRGDFRNTRKNTPAKENESDIVKKFRVYSQQYDAVNDRLERLVKISRDITIGSKRIIFLLHRISNQSEDEIQQQASESLKSVRENIVRVIDELGAEPYYRYQRAFSPGLQEYIEAASFLHYLLTRTLITPAQLLQDVLDMLPMKDQTSVNFFFSLRDYLLGIADLTGELMRYCVNSVASGEPEVCFEVYQFLQQVYNVFASLGQSGKEMDDKIEVMKTSLLKVENVCFTLRVRGAEYPKDLLASLLEGSGGSADE
eukprot:TRINITY_DN12176_c0_g1_i1.p1 TRINITY_DN12176_c0_g1~~TRINITY_DN12176_c0_g1_i1.p1  ORF type:complete len:279 (-),score=102.69 TRINITY_DN12176_c0_g1_i1:102-938(-)